MLRHTFKPRIQVVARCCVKLSHRDLAVHLVLELGEHGIGF